jgi:hypothetical protein
MALSGLVQTILLSEAHDLGFLCAIQPVGGLEFRNELERRLVGPHVALGIRLGGLDARVWAGFSPGILVGL